MTLEHDLQAFKDGRLSEPELRERIRRQREQGHEQSLSEGQRGLWIEYGRNPTGYGYNVPLGLAIRGQLQVEALEHAVGEALAEHPALASVFLDSDGMPLRRANHPTIERILSVEDWSGRDARAALDHLRARAREPFDLRRGPLLRLHLLRLAPDQHLALFAVHHIVFDGSSWPLLLASLLDAYDARVAGAPRLPLVERPAFDAFVAWEERYLASPQAMAHKEYWLRQLAPPWATLDLPKDRARAAGHVPAAANHSVWVTGEQAARLEAQCHALGAGPAMYLLAVFKLLLQRYCGTDDIIVGMPTMGRAQAQFALTVGYFVNMIAVRSRLRPEQSFAELLQDLRRTVADGMDHALYPFARLVRDLNAPRDRAPVYQVAYSYQAPTLFGRRGLLEGRASGLEFELLDELSRESAFGDYELALEACAGRGHYELSFKYDSQVFSSASIARLASHYLALLDGVLGAPEARLDAHTCLAPAEREAVLALGRGVETPLESLPTSVQQLVEAQVRATPTAVAVVCDAQTVTYRELNERANRLAHYLRQRGVRPDSLVAVCLPRSIEWVVALLGVLKSGGAYVPLDPGYPAERLRGMLSDAQARLVLTEASLTPLLPAAGAALVPLDTLWREIAACSDADLDPQVLGLGPEHLAYVIFTSGSTGRPKGAALPQRALVNLLEWQRRDASGARPQRTLQFAALGFDVAFQEIFSTLSVGGTLVLVPEAARADAHALLQYLRRENVQRLFLPFSALHGLAESMHDARIDLPRLQDVITAGEQLRIGPALIAFFRRLPGCRLHNHYGPTESHVVTALTLPEDPESWPTLPSIGRPIANTHIIVLDPAGQPVPVGVPGEIHIGGVCLARGYFGQPDLTAQRFPNVALAPAPDGRLYRTGDLGRLRDDGAFEFLGRNDDQVKVRGVRVELGEVEAQLSLHAQVGQVAVVARRHDAGETRLVAYLTPAPGAALDLAHVRRHLERHLPTAMLPSAYVVLPALPLTPNGKLDRRSLPEPDLRRSDDQGVAQAPQGPVEQALARVWGRLLRVPQVGRHDNFFDLGGHSLLAMQVIARVREELSIELTPSALFEHQTVAALAGYVEAAGQARELVSRRSASDGPRQRGVL